ncbi:MAG: hypothetical protein VKJ04_00070 [Vampirovibrionales bacterium]|nr:hypothetical protein [Vampirovibrionales bacterium]
MLHFGAYHIIVNATKPSTPLNKIAADLGFTHVERHGKDYFLETGEDPTSHRTFDKPKAASVIHEGDLFVHPHRDKGDTKGQLITGK